METKVDQLTTYNRNLEIQMGQLANAFNSRGQGNLPSKTEINPKEQCKVITLRSGKQLGQVSKEVVASDGEEVAHEEVIKENETKKIEHNETQSQPPLKLELKELQPTIISLQLVDRSIKYPLGRPFLATAGAVIDVKNDRLTFKVEAGVGICTNHGCTRLEFTV
ncbi:hypothetical protein NE237_009803 [Protea cynaroides]|uniref:Uncharacterized protein n=1 Tax=Protea cynaroides TaxID=273540 RepID=A0A9Q0KYC7_9MAGN|nr:hypothetical protein NE237_009803 [Protea cynaroides]